MRLGVPGPGRITVALHEGPQGEPVAQNGTLSPGTFAILPNSFDHHGRTK